jgi:hypothetical protein
MMMHETHGAQALPKEHETPAHATTEALTLGAISPLERNQMPGNATRHIPRWKMVIITLVPVYAGSTLLGLALFALFPGWPFPVLNGLMSLLLVLLLTYVTQPVAVRLLSDWLYAQPEQGNLTNLLRRLSVQGSLLLVLLPRTLPALELRLVQRWLSQVLLKARRALPRLIGRLERRLTRRERPKQDETAPPGRERGFLFGFLIGFALGLFGGIILHGAVAHAASWLW